MEVHLKPIISTRNISELDKKKIAWEIIKLLQKEGLSYQQAVELLEDTKDQLRNIPVHIV